MALKSSKNQASNRVEQPQIDADVYPAYLVQLIDMGLQPQRPFKGEEKPPQHEISVSYELAELYMVDDKGVEQEDKPRWVSETFPFYGLAADKARSTARYLALDPENIHDGDWSKLAGMACNVTVVLNKVGDKVYTNVGNVAPISAKKAAAMPPIKNTPRVFDLDAPDLDLFNQFPDWIKEKLKGNLNYAGSPLEALLKGAGSKAPDKQEKAPKAPQKAQDDDDGDNPY